MNVYFLLFQLLLMHVEKHIKEQMLEYFNSNSLEHMCIIIIFVVYTVCSEYDPFTYNDVNSKTFK